MNRRGKQIFAGKEAMAISYDKHTRLASEKELSYNRVKQDYLKAVGSLVWGGGGWGEREEGI